MTEANENIKDTKVYFKNFNILKQENDTDNSKKKLCIIYDYSKPQKRGYFYKYEGQENLESLKNARVSVRQWIRIDGILRKMDVSEKKFNMIKFCDPNLIEILYNKNGMEAVNMYIEQLEKGRKADKSTLPYKMMYNVRSILRNNKLPLKTRITMIKMVRKNKYVADIKMDSIFLKKGISLLVALGLSLISIPKLLPSITSERSNIKRQNSVSSDTFETDSYREGIQKSDRLVTVEDETQHGNENKIINDGIKRETDKNLKDNINNKYMDGRDSCNIESAKEQTEAQNGNSSIKLGSLIRLKEGTIFTESVYGGSTGVIGNYLSPSEGIYIIDHLCEVSDQGVINKYSLEGEINKTEEREKSFIHISFVSGAKTQEEAKKILDEQKANGKIDANIIQPRGWIKFEIFEHNSIVWATQNTKLLNGNRDSACFEGLR